MGLSEKLMPGGFAQGPGDTMTGPTGTSYPQGGFQIFLKELMSDPMRVFDAYKRGIQPVQSVPPVVSAPTVTPSIPSTITDEATAAPMGTSQIDAIRKAIEERERIKREI